MPDDKKVDDEKIAEQQTDLGDDEALKSFLEEDAEDGSGGGPEGDLNPDNEDDPDKKPDDDAQGKETKGKKAEKPEGDDDPDPDDEGKDSDYPDELTERLKSADEKQEPTPPEKKTPEVKEPKEPPADDSDFSVIMLDDSDLPDKEIKIGDHSINLKEYKDDYPEDYAAMIAVGSAIAKKNIQHLLDTGQLVKAKDLSDVHNKINDLGDKDFWNQIKLVHKDAVKINKDPTFTTWLSKQDEPLQRLAHNMEAPEDGILILDFYKKSIAKKKAETYDKGQKTKKDHHDNLHKGSMRTKKTTRQTTDGVDMNDAKAAFDEDDE